MSQYTYPPYGYGQYSGPPPPSQQQQQPYGYEAATQYPPPGYHQPYDPRGAEIHRAASQNSLNYNANQIPGLGIGPPPVAAAFGAVPDQGAWSQPPPFTTTVPGLVPPPQPSPMGLLGGPPHPTDYWSTPGAPHVTQSLPTVPQASQTQSQPQPPSSNDIEEGELSDGQFEDLYEPREIAKPQPTADQPASPVDTPEAGFYGNDDDDGAIPAVKDGPDTADGRERTGSYSPFLSPDEIRTENTTPQAVAGSGDNPSSPFLAPSQSAMLKAASDPQSASLRKDGEERTRAVPGLQYAPRQHVDQTARQEQAKDGVSNSRPSLATYDRFTSLQEAKKEAQKAILRLWPLGVKFQHYIEEGFDHKVIKALFGDLHLDMPKQDADSPKAARQTSVSAQVKTSAAQLSQSPDAQLPTASVKEPSSKPEESSKGEERKDRIARLLAAKAAKPLAAPNPKLASPQRIPVAQSQTERQSGPVGESTPPKSKTWGEMERLLQQKIAALQKSREAQALKQAAEEASLAFAANTAGPLPPLATQPNQLAAHRKRPVATDFVEYSSTVGPTKRPFGQNRNQSSLIIDVSDGSDDEEMDMDVDSPTDEPLPPRRGNGQRGLFIRDFPPLTDTRPPRQFNSPVPISQTPPNGPINGRTRETELDLKERDIQEMRRKIAEAEAKRKAKKSSGSQTPQASQTPKLKENDAARLPPGPQISTAQSPVQLRSDTLSAKLPKKPDLQPSNRLDKAERRGRIVSLELPQIDNSLEDKIRRLNQLRDEEARLKAEIDNELARKELLTKELDDISTGPSESASQPSGESSAGSSVPDSHTGSAAAEHTSSASVTPSSAPVQALGPESDGASDISMDEDQSSRESSQSPSSQGEPLPLHHEATVLTSAATEGGSVADSPEPQSGHSSEEDDKQPKLQSDPEQNDGAGMEITNPPGFAEQSGAAGGEEVTKADDNIQADLEVDQHSVLSESEVGSLSPPEQNPTAGYISADEGTDGSPNAEQVHQISGVGQPREDVQEIEDAQQIDGVAPKVVQEAPPKSEHAFRPYTSPLRYFHAYRFHSDYPSNVAGGLRSLTYSNRIDPKKPLCPNELAGQQCPGCEFQHCGSISIPDDQILVELGRSDDYIGDQKNRFIQGLRDLMQELKTKKVKDFDTIARGIINYRASFLGDPSKILHLEGVTL
ncbi:hypothetical protein B0T16DRAFT_14252 [Cercophora newfieldiana]|uniref:Uncharacterized protein n=1 Tax=Cercophora newfieldiana TaxID=92897 RepID=A0AA40CYV2_9PEZI|nr:hypothetical protein B0T16DRAFT_14252 [Cercophora newfieldiana]